MHRPNITMDAPRGGKWTRASDLTRGNTFKLFCFADRSEGTSVLPHFPVPSPPGAKPLLPRAWIFIHAHPCPKFLFANSFGFEHVQVLEAA